jgi:transcriptional regulator GlxA family with amidase domain
MSNKPRIVIPVYHGFDMLDVTGPLEMFIWAGYDAYVAAEKAEPVASSYGLALNVTTTFAQAGRNDVIWVPGAGSDALTAVMADHTYLNFLKAQAAHVRYVTAVCTGALLLGQAGLLDGYQATTHWQFIQCLSHFQNVTVAPGNPRFVLDRNRLTGGGISSGLDESLFLVELLSGTMAAQNVQLTTQYYPDPPVSSTIPASPPCQVKFPPKKP